MCVFAYFSTRPFLHSFLGSTLVPQLMASNSGLPFAKQVLFSSYCGSGRLSPIYLLLSPMSCKIPVGFCLVAASLCQFLEGPEFF